VDTLWKHFGKPGNKLWGIPETSCEIRENGRRPARLRRLRLSPNCCLGERQRL
jgi:hypothetical protein